MKKLLAMLLCICVLTGLCACGGEGASAPGTTAAPAPEASGTAVFRAGFGKVDFTPSESVPMGGYGNSKERMSTGIYSYLEARAVAVTDENGESLIFIVGDLSWCPKVLGSQIASKIEKVGSGFYGNFAEYGLYIFCKDDLSYDDVVLAMDYACDLQRHLDVKYSKIYLSLIDRLYVCDLGAADHLDHKTTCTSYPISLDMRRWFFMEALDKE